MLQRLGIQTTWFVPGHSIETFLNEMNAVADAGHEIGVHGYSHANALAITREQEAEASMAAFGLMSEHAVAAA